ncbi:MAG: MFS transporter [Sphingobium sp.]|nr:MFS transporter [Sphingobium sp.]
MTETAETAGPPKPKGKVRWIICALLFLAVVLSYIDRLVIGVLKPSLSAEYGWTETGYANMTLVFQAFYGIGFLFFGRLIDKIGARWGYLLAMGIWTVSHMAHALVTSTRDFALMRIPLAIGESGTYPAALAAASQWFNRRERAFAIGVFNAGANLGAIITPVLVPALTLTLGWQSAFIITGLFNIVWLVAWWVFYRKPRDHKMVQADELAWIESEPAVDVGRSSILGVLRYRQTWAYMSGRFLIDPIWWTFLFWLPDFFSKQFHVNLSGFGPPLVAIYLLSDVGAIAGGWTSSHLLGKGWKTGSARKFAMLLSALVVVPVTFSAQAPSMWLAVILIGMATAGHQGFSTNLFAIPGDLFPRHAQGAVVGLGGFAGALGSMIMSKYAGIVLESIGTYTPIFVVSGFAYLTALVVTHLFNPHYEPVKMDHSS